MTYLDSKEFEGDLGMIGTIAHEMLHAFLHLYSCKCRRYESELEEGHQEGKIGYGAC